MRIHRLELEYVWMCVLGRVTATILIRLANIVLQVFLVVLALSMPTECQGIALHFAPTALFHTSQRNTAKILAQVCTMLTLSSVNA